MSQSYKVFILGMAAIIIGFISMSTKDVIDNENYTVMYHSNTLFFIVGIILLSGGVFAICYLVWNAEVYQGFDEKHDNVKRMIIGRKSASELKHFGNVVSEIGLLFVGIGILGSPAFITFISSYMLYTLGRPEISYVPTLVIILIGMIVLIYGLWVKLFSLINEERNLSKIHSHSGIRSWHLSTGNLSALDSVSNRIDMAEIRKSKRYIRPLMILLILITAIVFNPLLSPVDGVHDSDLDGYADNVDHFASDPRLWNDEGISFTLNESENETCWVIVITQVQSPHQVNTNEVFLQIRDHSQIIFLPLPPTPLNEISSSYFMGAHFIDSAPLGYMNIGDELIIQKGVYKKFSDILLSDYTGWLNWGGIIIQ